MAEPVQAPQVVIKLEPIDRLALENAELKIDAAKSKVAATVQVYQQAVKDQEEVVAAVVAKHKVAGKVTAAKDYSAFVVVLDPEDPLSVAWFKSMGKKTDPAPASGKKPRPGKRPSVVASKFMAKKRSRSR